MERLIPGRCLRGDKSYLERQVQHRYALELSCDKPTKARAVTINAWSPEFKLEALPTLHERIAEIADAANADYEEKLTELSSVIALVQ